MSKTYRRKRTRSGLLSWEYRVFIYRIMGKTDDEIDRLRAVYHSDAYDCSFKEPGPSWYRKLYSERPMRRKNKEELRRFLLDVEYEPMCESKGKLPYWT